MKYVVDRIEGNFAICQDINTEENIDINILKLPKNIKEGDIIINVDNVFIIDKEETSKRTEKIKNKFNKLLKRKG